MARNPVQFQKGINLNEFLPLYGTEEQCFDALYRWRWPNGFVCPNCGHDRGCQLTTHKLQQCYRCNRQTSITAGTIFEATKLPLTVWFQGIYFMTQNKKGASAMTLHRQLGISCNAAWRMRHAALQEMMERDREHVLGGFIQLDDACLGGERSGGKRGRGAPGKTPFVAAVERPEFRWVNKILGNIKNALRGTCHAVRPKYAQRYLAEFEYRFNRRFDLHDIIPRLLYVALRTPPMPERLLKLRLA